LKKAKELIQEAWNQNNEQGTSTLVTVTLPFEGSTLHTAYVGDSSYCILRIYDKITYAISVVFVSKPQHRGFNRPYQLGKFVGDGPEQAIMDTHELQHGDILVLGSDGVFDNLSPEQVAEIIQKYLQDHRGNFDANMIANTIAQEAFHYSLDEKYNSPFAKEAARYGLKHRGGKSDDISVSLGQVRLAAASAAVQGDGSPSADHSSL
jgi:protein phosphatase PTC7